MIEIIFNIYGTIYEPFIFRDKWTHVKSPLRAFARSLKDKKYRKLICLHYNKSPFANFDKAQAIPLLDF